MKKLVLISAVLIAGCAIEPETKISEAGFIKKMDSKVGTDINDVIMSLGAPTSSFKMPNGNSIYTWKKEASGTTPMYTLPVYTAPTRTTYNAIGNSIYATTSPGYSTGGQIIGGDSYHYYCKLDFIAGPNNKVQSYRYEGNYCASKEE